MFQKLDEFTNKIEDLADKPTQNALELKKYFDSSPEELRLTLNKLIDDLASEQGASHIGVKPIATSPSDLQGMLEWLKTQVDFATLGQIPDGAITPNKLAPDSKKAATITIADTDNLLSSNNVEGALKELFQFADSGKKDIASVVGSPATNTNTFAQLKTIIQDSKTTLAANLTAKGQASTNGETLSSLVAKVANVNTGKKWAAGLLGRINARETYKVVGLNFRPTTVIVKSSGSSSTTSYTNQFSMTTNLFGGEYTAIPGGSNIILKASNVVLGGFDLTFEGTDHVQPGGEWIAYE